MHVHFVNSIAYILESKRADIGHYLVVEWEYSAKGPPPAVLQSDALYSSSPAVIGPAAVVAERRPSVL